MNPARAVREARRRALMSQSALAPRAALARLLNACGLALAVTPRVGAGIDRDAIRELLLLSPERRLPASLLRSHNLLCARQVHFVLVGAAAARLHGAPIDVESLEIVIDPDRRNVLRLRNAFRQDWVRGTVRLTSGSYPDLRLTSEDIPWRPRPARPRRVLNTAIGLPTGAVASLEELLRLGPPDRVAVLSAVQEERDSRQRGFRIYRRAYE